MGIILWKQTGDLTEEWELLAQVRLSSRRSPRLAVIICPGGHPPRTACMDSEDRLEW